MSFSESDIVGRRITNVFRSEIETDDESGMEFFNIYFELDGRDYLYVGNNTTDNPFKIAKPTKLQPFSTCQELPIEGTNVKRIVISATSTGMFLQLNDGRYVWTDDEECGTVLNIWSEDDFTHNSGYTLLVPYSFDDELGN